MVDYGESVVGIGNGGMRVVVRWEEGDVWVRLIEKTRWELGFSVDRRTNLVHL